MLLAAVRFHLLNEDPPRLGHPIGLTSLTTFEHRIREILTSSNVVQLEKGAATGLYTYSTPITTKQGNLHFSPFALGLMLLQQKLESPERGFIHSPSIRIAKTLGSRYSGPPRARSGGIACPPTGL